MERTEGQAGPHSLLPCLWDSRVTTGYAFSVGGTALQAAGSCSVIGPRERTEEKHDAIRPRPGQGLEKTGD